MMVIYSPDWTNTGFSFILLTVNLFRHSTLTEQGLYPSPGLVYIFVQNDSRVSFGSNVISYYHL